MSLSREGMIKIGSAYLLVDKQSNSDYEVLRHPGAKSLIDARDLADFTQAQGRMEDLLARISQNIDAIR